MDEVLTGAVPAMEAGRMGVAPSRTEGEPTGVGQSPQKEVQAGGAKPPRAKSSSKPRSRFPRAIPTDKGLGGAERACVEDATSSDLRAKAPLWFTPERGFVTTPTAESRLASTRDPECA
jgi:hypothetical protein